MEVKKRIIIPLIITVILLASFIGIWMYISNNDYVFKVNGQKITMSEFNPYLVLQKKMMEEEIGDNVWDMLINEAPAIETARDSAKQSIIDTVVKLQQAKARKISLSNEEKEKIKAYAENYTESLKEYGITKEEFIKINEDVALMDKLAVALYKEQDHSTHNHGKIDIDSYLKNEESSLGVTTFTSRNILFSTKDMTESEAEAVRLKAESVLNRALNGEDFASLATSYSEDPGSKDNGGLYENIERGRFVTEYENAALSLKAGEVYPQLVKSAYGYHIIKLESINNPDGYVSLIGATNIITSELNELATKWVAEAKVEVNEQQYNSAQ